MMTAVQCCKDSRLGNLVTFIALDYAALSATVLFYLAHDAAFVAHMA